MFLSISDVVESVAFLFELWIDTSFYIAFFMSLYCNLTIYVVTAITIEYISDKVTKDNNFGKYINERPFKNGQRKHELKKGLIACIIFSKPHSSEVI